MRRMMLLSLAFALAGVLCPSISIAADDTHLLVISIDGLRGDWAAHPDKNDLKIPTLRGLAARGVCADGVVGVFPSVTYPSHTTIITGCRPARHGIFANGVFDPPTVKSSERWHWDYKSIQVPTILDAAKAAGFTSAVVSWPVTVDAPVDINFPEVWAPGKFDDSFAEIARHCRPPELIGEVLTRYELGRKVGRDHNLTNVAKFIIDSRKPRLMLVHLVELDEAEHSHGPDSAEARAEAEQCDARVGEILERYKAAGLLDKTVVAIVSDHGFLAVNKTFCVNSLLRDKGLIDADAKGDSPARDFAAVGWIGGGSAAILLKNPDDAQLSAKVLARVREALAPYMGKADSPIRRIVERDEIERLGSNTKAALMLDPGDGWTFSGRLRGAITSESKKEGKGLRGMHGQLPDRPGLEATFVIAGPGIAAGANVGRMQMIDVGPTLAAAVGLSLPQAEGKPLAAVLARNAVKASK